MYTFLAPPEMGNENTLSGANYEIIPLTGKTFEGYINRGETNLVIRCRPNFFSRLSRVRMSAHISYIRRRVGAVVIFGGADEKRAPID